MGFLKRAIDFVVRPTHSRTLGILIFFVLVAAVSLTVYVAQQQQQLRQRAQSADCKQDYTSCVTAYNSCNKMCLGKNQKHYNSYEDYTNDYNLCVDQCDKIYYNACIQDIDIAYNKCLALLTVFIPTPSPTLAPTPTKTPTPTPSKAPSISCSNLKNCSACTSVNAQPENIISFCAWNGTECTPTTTRLCPTNKTQWFFDGCLPSQNMCAPTSTPPPPTSTPVPTTTFTTNCPTNSDAQCGAGTPPAANCKGLLYSAGTPISNCTKDLPNCWSCPLPTPTPTPSALCNDSNTVNNECFKRNGVFCAVGSSCKQNPNNSIKDCTCQSDTLPTPTPGPTSAPTPTAVPGSVQLALSVVQQGLTGTPVNRSRSVTAVLQGTDDQIITKIGTANFLNGTFNGTINLGVLPSGSYKLKVKVGNFLKSLISNLVISGTAASAQTTVVAGLTDQFNDNLDAISFYANGLRTCFGSTLGVKKCGNPEDVDLNGDASVDVIDYQIYLKGIRSLQQGLPVQ